MKFAISTDQKNVSQHFGRCPEFTLFELINDKIQNKEVIENPGHHPGFLPKFLNERNVKCIIAGGMGKKAVSLFSEYGIEQILGVSGSIDSVIEKLKTGNLEKGESICNPGKGKGYGVDKSVCDH